MPLQKFAYGLIDSFRFIALSKPSCCGSHPHGPLRSNFEEKGTLSMSEEKVMSPPMFSKNGILCQGVQTATEGIELSFTPVIKFDGVPMDFECEYQSFVETIDAGDEPLANPCPMFDRYSLETNAIVESGSALLIGISIHRKIRHIAVIALEDFLR